MTIGRYKQMIGRAGRAGMGSIGESILIMKDAEGLKVMQKLCTSQFLYSIILISLLYILL